MASEKPGVMLYFRNREPLKILSYEDKGKLLDAIMDYGEYGEIPAFDGTLLMAWGFIKPQIDYDSKHYDEICTKRKYSAFVRECKKKGVLPPTYSEWVLPNDSECYQMIPSTISNNNMQAQAQAEYQTESQSEYQAQTQTEREGAGRENPCGFPAVLALTDEEFEQRRETAIKNFDNSLRSGCSPVCDPGANK